MYEINNNLKGEAKNFPSADNLYKRLLAKYSFKIERADWDDPIGKEKQRQDIDLELIFQNNEDGKFKGPKNKKIISISEKFREKDFNDFLIELKQVDLTTGQFYDGWATKTKADKLAYFTKNTNKVRIITHDEEVNKLANYLIGREDIKNKLYENLNKYIQMPENERNSELKDARFEKYSFKFRDKTIKSGILTSLSYNEKHPSNKWLGVCLSIKWNDLKNIFNINYTEFNNFK